MALKGADKAALKLLMEEPGWDIVERMIREEVDLIRAEEATGTTEFDTLRMLHKNQGKVAGIKGFFDKLEREAFE